MNKYIVTVHYIIEKKYHIEAESAKYIEEHIGSIVSAEDYECVDDNYSFNVSDVEVYEIEYAEEAIEDED